MKRKFLTAYDYKMGAIWMYFLARSADEIVSKYPELTVFDPPPAWFGTHKNDTDPPLEVYDIDVPPHGWLKEAVENNWGKKGRT